MSNPALTEALTQIATAANAALAALASEDSPTVETRDYQADELERIEAETAAAVAIIEAEAAATVAIIEAETPPDDGDSGAELLDLDPGDIAADVADLIETDDIETELLGTDAGTDDLADAADIAAAVETATDVIDALPTLDIIEAAPDDFPPSPVHWYKKPLFGRR